MRYHISIKYSVKPIDFYCGSDPQVMQYGHVVPRGLPSLHALDVSLLQHTSGMLSW